MIIKKPHRNKKISKFKYIKIRYFKWNNKIYHALY